MFFAIFAIYLYILTLYIHYLSHIQIVPSILYFIWQPYVQWDFSACQPQTAGILVGSFLLSSCGRQYLCKFCYSVGHSHTFCDKIWVCTLGWGVSGVVLLSFFPHWIPFLGLRYSGYSLPLLFLYSLIILYVKFFLW